MIDIKLPYLKLVKFFDFIIIHQTTSTTAITRLQSDYFYTRKDVPYSFIEVIDSSFANKVINSVNN
jgi:hypothetical protein